MLTKVRAVLGADEESVRLGGKNVSAGALGALLGNLFAIMEMATMDDKSNQENKEIKDKRSYLGEDLVQMCLPGEPTIDPQFIHILDQYCKDLNALMRENPNVLDWPPEKLNDAMEIMEKIVMALGIILKKDMATPHLKRNYPQLQRSLELIRSLTQKDTPKEQLEIEKNIRNLRPAFHGFMSILSVYLQDVQ